MLIRKSRVIQSKTYARAEWLRYPYFKLSRKTESLKPIAFSSFFGVLWQTNIGNGAPSHGLIFDNQDTVYK